MEESKDKASVLLLWLLRPPAMRRVPARAPFPLSPSKLSAGRPRPFRTPRPPPPLLLARGEEEEEW